MKMRVAAQVNSALTLGNPPDRRKAEMIRRKINDETYMTLL